MLVSLAAAPMHCGCLRGVGAPAGNSRTLPRASWARRPAWPEHSPHGACSRGDIMRSDQRAGPADPTPRWKDQGRTCWSRQQQPGAAPARSGQGGCSRGSVQLQHTQLRAARTICATPPRRGQAESPGASRRKTWPQRPSWDRTSRLPFRIEPRLQGRRPSAGVDRSKLNSTTQVPI
jgi:hypothetical protein